jgi:hypothetical protein
VGECLCFSKYFPALPCTRKSIESRCSASAASSASPPPPRWRCFVERKRRVVRVRLTCDRPCVTACPSLSVPSPPTPTRHHFPPPRPSRAHTAARRQRRSRVAEGAPSPPPNTSPACPPPADVVTGGTFFLKKKASTCSRNRRSQYLFYRSELHT